MRGARCEVRGARCEVRGARCEVRGARCEVRGAKFLPKSQYDVNKKAELMLGFSVLTNLITQQQFLQQLGDLQAQCKPLELCHQHGSQLLGYECNRPDEQQNVDLVR